MNLQIMEFENAILNFCNQSDLPSEVKRLVFLEILGKVEKQANKDINLEIAQRQESERQKEKENKTIEIGSSGEVVEDEQGISEDCVGELSE